MRDGAASMGARDPTSSIPGGFHFGVTTQGTSRGQAGWSLHTLLTRMGYHMGTTQEDHIMTTLQDYRRERARAALAREHERALRGEAWAAMVIWERLAREAIGA